MVATRRAKAGGSNTGGENNAGDTDLSVIPKLHQRQEKYYETGATRSLQWRKTQLQALYSMLQDNTEAWKEALRSDLGKNNIEVSRFKVTCSLRLTASP